MRMSQVKRILNSLWNFILIQSKTEVISTAKKTAARFSDAKLQRRIDHKIK